jgi:hypothetical protein
MGYYPTKAADNMFCKCRKEAAIYNDKLYSREGAAELLGISVSCLADYELGNSIVPVDKVLLMSDLYNAPELKALYCKECCPLGCSNPHIVLEDLDRTSLKVLSTFRKVAGIKESLLNIVEDGVISEEEKPVLKDILSVMDEFEIVIKTFKLWAEKNIKTD